MNLRIDVYNKTILTSLVVK